MDDEGARTPRQDRWRDIWQLHIPLVVVLLVCAALTVIEARRATEGVWRAWWYMFEWPVFGLFAIWVWHRYRTEGNVARSMVQRWRDRVEEYEAEAPPPEPAASPIPDDPELLAWQEYADDLKRREPPGGPA